MNKIYLILLPFISISFFTLDAYAATLILVLTNVDRFDDLQAIVNNVNERFDDNGQAVFPNVDLGSYDIDIQNLQGENIRFNVLNTSECEGTIESETDVATCNIAVKDSFDGDFAEDSLSDSQGGVADPTAEISIEMPPAKFNVKTVMSDECLSSPSCAIVKEKDIEEIVYQFSSATNQYSQVSSFPGSNLSRHLVFDADFNFKYGWIQLDVDASQKIYPSDTDEPVWVKLEYNSCSIYLYIGQEANCTITVKPFTHVLAENRFSNSTS